MNSPFLVLALSFVLLWFALRIGVFFRQRRRGLDDETREEFAVIVAANLTLLGLIIGFSFAMAVSRYDQRKNYEEAEANAIATEYARADLLPLSDAVRIRVLLKDYLDQRLLFYQTRDENRRPQIDAGTAQLQAQLWSAVQVPAAAKPTPVIALAVSGMNDVLNSQGYTQAAWWNRIPPAAWGLMAAIAICCNLILGYGARRSAAKSTLPLVVPLIVSISFFLIADIDSPRGGTIRVRPQNLMSLSESLRER
jgi:anti-sigma-K factor RskA